jgi:hypothetical protein
VTGAALQKTQRNAIKRIRQMQIPRPFPSRYAVFESVCSAGKTSIRFEDMCRGYELLKGMKVR